MSILILLYSAYYYGGLYQIPYLKTIGQLIFFIMIIYIVIKKYIFNKYISLSFIVFFYLFLAFWTISTSPHPHVDTIIVLKEAPFKFLQGINPYNTTYTRVYSNILPNYYNYLPFSILFFLPFDLLFQDPRYALLITNFLSFLLLFKMVQNTYKKRALLPVSLILFLPGSFYMIEHAYLDQVVFFFFILSIFCLKKSYKTFYLILSLFFSFKQNLILLFPYFINIKHIKKYYFYILSPFVLIFPFLFWNPSAFIKNVVSSLKPEQITSPINSSLTVPTFIINSLQITWNIKPNVYMTCFFIFVLLYIYVLFKKNVSISQKTILIIFISYFFSYHAFFNSYFLVGLFIVYDFIKTEFIPSELKKQLP